MRSLARGYVHILYISLQAGGARFTRPLLHPFCMNIPSCSYTHCMRYHVSTAVKGQTLLLRRGHSKGEFMGIDEACDLINQETR